MSQREQPKQLAHTPPTPLTAVERAILDILVGHHGDEVPARVLRGLLSNRGFRRSAPALVFTMMNLADKGLVSCREEVTDIDGVEVRDRYYRIREGGLTHCH